MTDETDTIAKRWKELSGVNNWEGLLDPLDYDLRRYLIHYGEMAQATYDAFNSERASKYAGSSRYARRNLFSKVGLERSKPLMKYQVIRYFYATAQLGTPEAFIVTSYSTEAWCKQSNWMGYVAVATDEGKAVLGRRDIVIAWRGTVQVSEWFKDFDAPLESASEVFGEGDNPRVHRGWLSIYTSSDPQSSFSRESAREQVLSEVKRLVNEYKDEEISISITGHSLGASLATLNASDIVSNKIHIPENNSQNQKPSCLVTVFSFASPHVGDSHFVQMVRNLKDLRLLQIRNVIDIIPFLPPWYPDVGEHLLIDSLRSTFLRIPGDIRSWHMLEVYLHVIAGTQGSKGGFQLEVDRDISLVNKTSGALRNEYQVPPHWWCSNNKGMIQKSDGHWTLCDHENDGESSLLFEG